MQGIRNPYDKLWDIPVHKRSITPTNYCMPPIYPGMYPQRVIKKKETSSRPSRATTKKPKTIIRNKVQNFSDTIDCKILDQHIAKNKLINAEQYYATKLEATNPSMAVIIKKKQTHTELIKYLHATCFSPVRSTWNQAIDLHFFKTWPGLTKELLNKYLPPSIPTTQGHMHQERQHLQSTQAPKNSNPRLDKIKAHLQRLRDKQKPGQSIEDVLKDEIDADSFPSSPQPNEKTNDVIYAVIKKEELSTAYTDLTGRFPLRSSRGNQYILVGYHYDGNCIIGTPVKDRKAPTLTKAWESLHKKFTLAGLAPNNYVMDNEISDEFISALTKHNVTYQLVPPHTHRRNLAERAIQTYKNHFKAGLASVDPNFPLSEWDRLINQANITLNMLRASRSNPKVSAYTYVFGEFDFASTPMAPPGTKIVTHRKPNNRGTWELNGEVGWYVGPAMHHYRCVNCYFPRTKTERNCDTVTFFPAEIPFPRVKLQDFLVQAATDIITLLTSPPSTTTPSLQAGDPVRNALLTLATQLKRIDKIQTVDIPDAPPPRVARSTIVNNKQPDTSFPRVKLTTPTSPPAQKIVPKLPASTLQIHSKQLRNARFNTNRPHRYPLRSKPQYQQPNYKHLATQQLVAQHLFQPKAHHIFKEDGSKATIDSLLNSADTQIWTRSLSNEWGRLAKGNKYGVHGTDTIEFIHKHELPNGQRVTYATYVLDYRHLKEEQHRVRITVGGDRLIYPGDTGSPAANLLETKILINSTISDAHKGARFMSADIKDYFLATPMPTSEYMKVQYRHIPEDIRLQYHLQDKITKDNCIYIKIKKGMYGLKQAAVLAYNELKKNLKPAGYSPVLGTVGMWQHATRQTKFCLCVDDFGIKYHSKEDADHLLQAIGKHYRYTTDWKGTNYCGLAFKWDYAQGYVDISMPEYVTKMLKRLQHAPKTFPQYSPHTHVPKKYATKNERQYSAAPDTSPLLSPLETKYIQSVTGSHLYYGRAIDSTILPALNEIASEQAQPTQQTKQKAQRLMDYVNTYPNTYIRYYASNMILHIDSDAAYLVAPKARSRIAGYYYFSNHPSKNTTTRLNGAIHVECKTLRHVVSSAAEAEIAGVYHNAQTAIPMRTILEALGHSQPPTPIKTDNSTANGFIHDNIHQKRSKSWDMRYYWLRDRHTQKQFLFFWDKGSNNEADYFTKHFPAVYHRHKRSRYVQDKLHLLQDFLTHHPFPCPMYCEGVLLRSMTS